MTQNENRKRPRPVLMIPVRRCGSHALRLRLNMSPDFYAPYPLHIVDFMPLVELYGDLANDQAYFQLIMDVIGLQSASMVKWNITFDPVKVFDAIKDRPRSVHAVVWELLFQIGLAQGKRVVMDKSLDSVHYADELIRLFPDILFLNVVRDPRAQISSMNRAIIHEFDSTLNTRIWVKAHHAARALAKNHPDRVLTIRYEDFLTDQEQVLLKICGFMGIGFVPEMLEAEKSTEAKEIAKISALWESNASKPIRANIDKFRTMLSSEEIEVIETLAGEHMDYYGYERMTRGVAVVDATAIERANKRSQAKRVQAWSDLKSHDPRDYQLRKFRARYLQMVETSLRSEGPADFQRAAATGSR